MRIVTFLLIGSVAAFGCKKHEDPVAGAGSGSAATPGSASGSGAGTEPAMQHHAGNCPSTIVHTTTSSSMDGSNVLVTITSDDKEAIMAVQKRTDELLEGRKEHKADAIGNEHKQNGEHGGGMGLCPIYVPESATATAQHVDHGVIVTITTANATVLKAEVDARIQRASDWVKANIPADAPGPAGTQGGVGGGKNEDGMNRSGQGDGKGIARKHGDGAGGGSGTGGGGGGGTGGGRGSDAGSGSSATP